MPRQGPDNDAATLGARTGPVAVAGDSAGGNLGAVVAQRDAAAGRGRIGLQALIYPWLDLTRTDRGSHVAFATGYGLRTQDLEECMRLYVPAGTDRANSDMSPLHAKSLAGVPSATVITEGFDPLREDFRRPVSCHRRDVRKQDVPVRGEEDRWPGEGDHVAKFEAEGAVFLPHNS